VLRFIVKMEGCPADVVKKAFISLRLGSLAFVTYCYIKLHVLASFEGKGGRDHFL
jgi:hypothetical protein